MMEKRDLSAVADQVTDDELLTTLLEATGDLDKAQVLRNTLPAWLAQAQPATLAALEQAHRDSELPRRQVKRLLEKLQPLHAFCVERLHTFLLSKGVQAVDVEHDQLELPKVKYTGMMPPMTGPLIETITWTKRSLVTAAMQNFDAAKAGSGGLPARAVIRSAATGHVVTELTVEQFVGYCRELDVGQAYQRHLREVFNLPALHEQLLANSGYNPAAVQIGQSKLLDMQIDLHMACARQDVSAAAGERLLKLIKADRSAEQLTFLTALEKPWIWQGLN
ncbi:dermonecrotic toxin domain-containing protein, partial [Pseudomonas syringae]|uniref:dermonecrotic toxin domain-containing protein n=1 Tax=Pseudomonas syringae TaxID=317 RepID=UPI001F896F41